jgi:hypothetical protein
VILKEQTVCQMTERVPGKQGQTRSLELKGTRLSLTLMQPGGQPEPCAADKWYALLMFGHVVGVVTMQSELSHGAEEALRCNVLWLLEDDIVGGMFRTSIL